MTGFSIIVCCYNSAERVARTLAHLAALDRSGGILAELIIIDNCCTDNTVAVAAAAWTDLQAPFEMRILRERTQGLSAAREKGIQAARYDNLLFCDDDNLLDPAFLQVASAVLTGHPHIAMLGGLGTPLYEKVPSYWPEDFYVYGSGRQAAENGRTLTLYGAALLLRKPAFLHLKEAGFNFILCDRKGDKLSSGGDYELCLAMALAGYEIWYHDGLKFFHLISEQRMTWRYCRRFISDSAPAVSVLDTYHFVLKHGKGKSPLFYLMQIKYLLHHTRKAFQATYTGYRYRRDEKIRFLGSFHRRFHLTRVMFIARGFPRSGRNLKKVVRLKEQLTAHGGVGGQAGPPEVF